MSVDIKALVVLDSGVNEDVVRGVVAKTPKLEVAALAASSSAGWTALKATPSDVVLVACQPGSERASWFVREVAREHPDRPLLLLSATSSNGFVRHAFEMGADDLVVLPDVAVGPQTAAAGEELYFALEKAIARRSAPTAGAASAPALLICVLGPKGGVGKTLTSTNLATALAKKGARVTVVDLDLQFGDIGLSLGLTPQRTIHDLLKSGGSLDAEKIEAYLTRHPSGLRVLMPPIRPDQAGAVSIEFLRELYPLLRTCNDVVIVDTPPGFSPEVITSIDLSSHICMVGTLDSFSLKNTKLGLETLELMGYEDERIRLVLNRADTHVGVTHEDVIAVIGRRPDVLISSHCDVARSSNEGMPIVLAKPGSEAAKAFATLAAMYTTGGPVVPPRRRWTFGRRNG